MSQTALAAEMTKQGHVWYQQTVGRIESGQQQMRFAEAVALAEILHVTLDRLTWPTPEASSVGLLNKAADAIRQSHEKIAAAVQYGLAGATTARRLLGQTEGDESKRVQEARTEVMDELERFSVNEALEEGARRHNEIAREDEQIGFITEVSEDVDE